LINDNKLDQSIFIEGSLNNTIAAEFQAFILISKYLNQKINEFKTQPDRQMVTQPKVHFNHQLNWTTAISKCVEICYALYLLKIINNGSATLKQITDAFSNAFNIDLSDYAQSMKYIKKRKRDGLFLTEMSNTLFSFISHSNQ
jgi:hypothetical protein